MRKTAEKARPSLVFTGLNVVISETSRHSRPFRTPAEFNETSRLPFTLFVYTDKDNYRLNGLFLVNGKDGEGFNGTVFGPKRRADRADRVLWTDPQSGWTVYRTLASDIADLAQGFTPEMTSLIVNGPPKTLSVLDRLVPHEQILEGFINQTLEVIERACIAGVLNPDEIERDYAILQKVLNLATNSGAAVGERATALARVEERIKKMVGKVAQ